MRTVTESVLIRMPSGTVFCRTDDIRSGPMVLMSSAWTTRPGSNDATGTMTIGRFIGAYVDVGGSKRYKCMCREKIIANNGTAVTYFVYEPDDVLDIIQALGGNYYLFNTSPKSGPIKEISRLTAQDGGYTGDGEVTKGCDINRSLKRHAGDAIDSFRFVADIDVNMLALIHSKAPPAHFTGAIDFLVQLLERQGMLPLRSLDDSVGRGSWGEYAGGTWEGDLPHLYLCSKGGNALGGINLDIDKVDDWRDELTTLIVQWFRMKAKERAKRQLSQLPRDHDYICGLRIDIRNETIDITPRLIKNTDV